MPVATYAIEIKNLTKLYGANKALKDVSFTVNRGEVMGFLGPNGAGKSTTMNIICGCISANSGSALVCGCDVLENPKIVKSKIGYLPEQPPLYFDMTVCEYLDFVCEIKNVKKNKKQHIREVMETVKISHMEKRMIKNLSKGYKQRVGLAQALIGNPEVLILDEPTVGLDPKQIIEIRNVIKELGKSRTVILSTHILQEVEAVCDRVTIISNGKIVAQNTIDELTENAVGENEFLLTVDSPSAKNVIGSIDGVKSVRINREEDNKTELAVEQFPDCDIRQKLTRVLADEGISILQLRSAAPTLEEIFIRLTNNYSAVEDEASEEPEKKNLADVVNLFKKKDENNYDATVNEDDDKREGE